MSEAYRRTRKDGATGIDGVTAADYEKDLEANLESLLNRIKSGSYRAPPVRRHYIPKADGTKRPLGIPTFEDKVAQRAILMLLEPIYETDFLPCSYGSPGRGRRGRSAHDALSALRTGIIEQRQRWVIDADISKYFDSITHSHLRARPADQGRRRKAHDRQMAGGARCPQRVANGHHRAAPAVGDRCRYLEVLRLDYTLPPPVPFLDLRIKDGVARTHDRQMAESGGARRGRLAQAGGWHPSGRGDLADALERLPAPCAGRVVRESGEAAPPRTVPASAIRR